MSQHCQLGPTQRHPDPACSVVTDKLYSTLILKSSLSIFSIVNASL
uniref:Uncharacterized protein n=1 Tax=Anguilla anguilla TaxID=7936 RepID=A0A0E9QMB1_ANGAN